LKKNKRTFFPIIFGFSLILIFACGSKDSSKETDQTAINNSGKKILRIAYNREIDVLNPFTSQNLIDIELSMIEGLITSNDKNEYIPVLAKEIPTVENGLIIHNENGTVDMTWRLHENVYWHDGEEFTSEDVHFTWKFVRSENSATYNQDWYYGIIGCRTPDKHTIVFTWDGEYAYYAGVFEAILPEHILGHMTTDEIINYEPYNRGSKTIGTGPFKFAEWKSGEYIRVVRNDNYWRGSDYPEIDEIVWTFIPDNNTRLNAMKAGKYDYGQIEPRQVKEVANLNNYRINLINSNSFMHFDLNLKTERGRGLFNDINVRKAIYHAIDREAIAEQLMEGTVKVSHTPINTTSPYYNPNVKRYDYDPELSKRMLDEAGWLIGPDGIRTKNGNQFSFVLINRAGSADRIAIAQVIQAQLKTIGIEVLFETLESAAWTQRWRSSNWEGIISAWFLPADPSMTNSYANNGGNNMTGLFDETLDEIMWQSDKALSFDIRKPLLDKAQELFAEKALSLLIYHNVVPELVQNRVGNYKGSGTNFGSFWNLYEWTLED